MHDTPPLQVVPTCTCPANRNVKDCCAGIMHALSKHEKFGGWYGHTWQKRELLDRRHRADCDPFIDIANVLERPAAAKVIAYIQDDAPRVPRKAILTPDGVDAKWKELLAKAGHDQHLVSRPIPFYSCVHNILSCSKLGHFHTCVHKRSRCCKLGNLLDTIEEGDVKMTASLQDKMIAYKGQSGKHISPIEYTKTKKSKRSRDEAPVYPQSNQSPLTLLQPVKRQKGKHPGNNSHIPWNQLHLCVYCNQGVQQVKRHQGQSKKCAAQQTNPSSARYVLCPICSEALQKPFGHLTGQVCPRALSSQ